MSSSLFAVNFMAASSVFASHCRFLYELRWREKTKKAFSRCITQFSLSLTQIVVVGAEALFHGPGNNGITVTLLPQNV